MNSRWREPIHLSATLLSGAGGEWHEIVTELDSEISMNSRVHPEFPFFETRIWQKDHIGLALAVLRGSGKREIWLLSFRCTLASPEENERSIRVKTEIQIQNRLAALDLRSRSQIRFMAKTSKAGAIRTGCLQVSKSI